MKKLRLGVNTKVLIGIMAIMGAVMLIAFKVFEATNSKSRADEESLGILEYVAQINQTRIKTQNLSCLVYENNLDGSKDSSAQYSLVAQELLKDVEELTVLGKNASQTDTSLGQLKKLGGEIPAEFEVKKPKKSSSDEEEVKEEAAAEKFVGDEILLSIESLDTYLENAEKKSQEKLTTKREEAKAKKTSLIWWIAFGTLLCSSMALLTALIVVFFVTKPLVKVTNVIDSISKGNLATSIDGNILGTNDEIGDLARAFDRTMVSLKLAMKKNKKQKR